MVNKEFGQFVNKCFLAWCEQRINDGLNRGTVTEFAKALDIHQGDLSHMLAGRRVPGVLVLQKLAANPLIGPRIWQAAMSGRFVSDPHELRALAALDNLPEPMKERWLQVAEQMKSASPNPDSDLSSFGQEN